MPHQYTCGIYKLTTPDGRFYIGSSRNIEKRLQNHLSSLSRNSHVNARLQCAWNDGVRFTHEIIELCDASMLIEREQIWIDALESYRLEKGFNMLKRAYSKPTSEETRRRQSEERKGRQRKPLSEATKRKISESHKGMHHSDVMLARMGAARKGVPLSEEHRSRISKAKTGIPHPHKKYFPTEEVKQKISESHKGMKFSEEARLNMSKARRGVKTRPCPLETRLKISAAQIGKPRWSEEERRQISEAQKRYNALKREKEQTS